MMQYRKEIDGLRAIAVVLVILNHLGITFFKGGYVGVDVFFGACPEFCVSTSSIYPAKEH